MTSLTLYLFQVHVLSLLISLLMIKLKRFSNSLQNLSLPPHINVTNAFWKVVLILLES